MKRPAALVLLVAGVFLVLALPGILENLALFVLAGIIPGTKLSIPPLVMLVGLGVLFLAVLYWAKRRKFYMPKSAQTSKVIVSKKTRGGRKAGTRRLRQSSKRLARQTA